LTQALMTSLLWGSVLSGAYSATTRQAAVSLATLWSE
jgi:hypothetical protein